MENGFPGGEKAEKKRIRLSFNCASKMQYHMLDLDDHLPT